MVLCSWVIFMRLRIRDLREDADLTQQQIAEYLHCDQSLYSKYERGERDVPLYVIVCLAEFFDTNMDYLIGRTDVRAPLPKAR